MNQRIVVTGATGLIGRPLCQQLIDRGYELTILSRSPETAEPLVPGAKEYVHWSATERGEWEFHFDGAHAVINLAGQPILEHRWGEDFKKDIYDSRVVGTRRIVNAIRRVEHKPAVLINASAIGYYGYDGDSQQIVDESTPSGDDFFAQVCFGWELEAKQAEFMGVRVVPLRMGLVLGPGDGALRKMMRPFRMGFGGHIEPGSQWFSWIHIEDMLRVIHFALDTSLAGPVNCTTEHPVTSRELAATIGKVMNRKDWFALPEWMVSLGFGEAAPLITNGKRVLPSTLTQAGFTFNFPTIEEALQDLVPRILRKR